MHPPRPVIEPRFPNEIYDRFTGKVINYKSLHTEKEVAKLFGLTKGQLAKLVSKGQFPKATVLLAGHIPRWADTILNKIRRVEDDIDDAG